MKTRYAVDQFFSESLRPYAGGVLVVLRITFAYACFVTLLTIHEGLAARALDIPTQTAPLVMVLIRVWGMEFWNGLLTISAALFMIGFMPRVQAGLWFLFLMGSIVVHSALVTSVVGAWLWVMFALLGVTFCAQWGQVGGVDELLLRVKKK